MNKFSAEICRRRGTCGLSVRDAAAEAGISPATFNRVERGSLPDVLTFKRLVYWSGMPAAVALRMIP